EQSLAQAQSAANKARNGVLLAKANLNRLLGQTQGTEVDLAPVNDLPTVPPPTESLAPEAARSRPEARGLRARIQVAEASVHLARSQRLPGVAADAYAALTNPSAFIPTASWLLGLTASMPIFETANT